MQTQLDIAKHTLFDRNGLHVSNVKMFPGTSRDVTGEQMAQQMNKLVANLLRGDFEEISDCDD